MEVQNLGFGECRKQYIGGLVFRVRASRFANGGLKEVVIGRIVPLCG